MARSMKREVKSEKLGEYQLRFTFYFSLFTCPYFGTAVPPVYNPRGKNFMSKQNTHTLTLLLLLSALWLFAACGGSEDAPTSAPADGGEATVPTIASEANPVETEAGQPTEPPTIAPTATPQLAALVNGQFITLAEFEQELARYEQAQALVGSTPPDNYRQLVLQALIEQQVIAQAATQLGITVTPDMVAARLAELETEAGGAENLDSWLMFNQLTREEFAIALGQEMLTEQVVRQVTQDVPTAVEQVRARYIQVSDTAVAQTLVAELAAGADFGTLAQLRSEDLITGPNGGDLGFFARGSLLIPELEEAAFALETNQTSELLTITGLDGQTKYYLIQVTERDPARPLSAEERARLLQERFETWLAERLAAADIQRFVE
jgi:peptidyl-prolyl cis-trans isomerase C